MSDLWERFDWTQRSSFGHDRSSISTSWMGANHNYVCLLPAKGFCLIAWPPAAGGPFRAPTQRTAASQTRPVCRMIGERADSPIRGVSSSFFSLASLLRLLHVRSNSSQCNESRCSCPSALAKPRLAAARRIPSHSPSTSSTCAPCQPPWPASVRSPPPDAAATRLRVAFPVVPPESCAGAAGRDASLRVS